MQKSTKKTITVVKGLNCNKIVKLFVALQDKIDILLFFPLILNILNHKYVYETTDQVVTACDRIVSLNKKS